VEQGLEATNEALLEALEQSPRSIGDEAFRAWVDDQHAALLGKGLNEEDVQFRREREWMNPDEVMRRVAQGGG